MVLISFTSQECRRQGVSVGWCIERLVRERIAEESDFATGLSNLNPICTSSTCQRRRCRHLSPVGYVQKKLALFRHLHPHKRRVTFHPTACKLLHHRESIHGYFFTGPPVVYLWPKQSLATLGVRSNCARNTECENYTSCNRVHP